MTKLKQSIFAPFDIYRGQPRGKSTQPLKGAQTSKKDRLINVTFRLPCFVSLILLMAVAKMPSERAAVVVGA
jgi:hypothetical protein